MFEKQPGIKQKYRITFTYFLREVSEEEALKQANKLSRDQADEVKVTKVR